MSQDEQEIRELIATWNERARNGDVDGVLALMTDDVVFNVVGRPPFGSAEFATQAREMRGSKIDAEAELLELTVRGDVAWSRVKLRITMTKPSGDPATREGYAMSIYLRQPSGHWLLARDANLLGPPK
jgi:uncharacterized protein (TIGR02246 family)